MRQPTYSAYGIGFAPLLLTDDEVDALQRVELPIQPVVDAIYGRRAIGRAVAVESLAGPTTTCSATAAIFRVSGDATVAGVSRAWSAVAKLVHPRGGRPLWETSTDPFDPFHVYREVDINRLVLPHLGTQPLARETPGRLGIVAPKLLTDTSLGNGRHLMWFEDVAGRPGRDWPVERMVLACRHLGQTQGAFRTPEGVPAALLRQSWLRAHLSRYDIDATCLDASKLCNQEPFGSFTPAVLTRVGRLWQQTNERLDILDRLPQTFCHRDFWLGNLIAATDSDGLERTVAFDWAFAGLGAIGEEAGTFVANTMVDLQIEPENLRSFARDCLNAYIQGLADVGWKGNRAWSSLVSC